MQTRKTCGIELNPGYGPRRGPAVREVGLKGARTSNQDINPENRTKSTSRFPQTRGLYTQGEQHHHGHSTGTPGTSGACVFLRPFGASHFPEAHAPTGARRRQSPLPRQPKGHLEGGKRTGRWAGAGQEEGSGAWRQVHHLPLRHPLPKSRPHPGECEWGRELKQQDSPPALAGFVH